MKVKASQLTPNMVVDHPHDGTFRITSVQKAGRVIYLEVVMINNDVEDEYSLDCNQLVEVIPSEAVS